MTNLGNEGRTGTRQRVTANVMIAIIGKRYQKVLARVQGRQAIAKKVFDPGGVKQVFGRDAAFDVGAGIFDLPGGMGRPASGKGKDRTRAT